ncbi:enolase-like domain-containing protein [Natronococcus wangiae]|uniref:enolase C-terminal domain-like protein n=1 Tax=Natronococcus wangiae TaxID=3068275 RepID=UPI00273E4E7C|nr:enolase C-terminal domain-like protein [Natronococcus sp. AD5]
MTVSVRSVDQYVLDMELRMPFHFGNTTLTELPHLFVRVECGGELAGREGVAAEGLSPLWFLKEPDVTFADGLDRMLEVVDEATARAAEIDADTVFDFWLTLYGRQREWAATTAHPPLLWSFGASLVERAVIDAFCRARGTTFDRAIRRNAFGIDLGEIYPELAGTEPADYLPAEPRRTTAIRHTVGFTDPLTDADLDAESRLEDGLPQTLTEYVEEQGVSFFKIKLSGDVDRDANRLARLADELEEVTSEYAVTFDANEQYGDAESFRADWDRLTNAPGTGALLDRLRYVEQPLARGDALTDATRGTFTGWDARPPMIIDESDGELWSLARALECGYVGTSHKNCKGVFKGIANACLVERRRREDQDTEYVISGEDLSTVGPVSLLQDLSVMATMGKRHVERNGHHYFRGAAILPAELQDELLETHGDLYREHERGYPTLDVDDGQVSLETVVESPFGYAADLDLERFAPRPEWEFAPSSD